MALDINRIIQAAAEAALENQSSGSGQQHDRNQRKRKGLLTAPRALLVGAGMATAGRLVIRARGSNVIDSLQQRLATFESEHFGSGQDEPDDDFDEDEEYEDEPEEEPEGEYDEDEEPQGEYDDEEEPEGEAEEEPEGEYDEDEPEDEAEEEPEDEAEEEPEGEYDEEEPEAEEEPERKRAAAGSRRGRR